MQCIYFSWIIFTPETVKEIDANCRKAAIGCTDCKKMLAQRIAEALTPIHERMDYYINHMDEINEIIAEGNKKAAKIAGKLWKKSARQLKSDKYSSVFLIAWIVFSVRTFPFALILKILPSGVRKRVLFYLD